MERNYRNNISFRREIPKINHKVLNKEAEFFNIMNKLDEYRKQVSELAHSYDDIETIIRRALSDIITFKKKPLEDLIQEINDKMEEINDIEKDSSPSEEGDVLITKFKAQNLRGLLPKYEDLQLADLNPIMHQLNQHFNISSELSELKIQLRNYKDEQARLLKTIDSLESESSSKESKLQSQIHYLKTQIKQLEDYQEAYQERLGNPQPRKRILPYVKNILSRPAIQQHLEHPIPQLLNTFEGHTGTVSSVCMSADNRWIVSGSSDHSVRLWNVGTKSQQVIPQGHTRCVTSVFISADSKWIVSGSWDTTVRLWSLVTMRLKAILIGHYSTVRSVCISADSRLIVSASGDYSIRIWSVKTMLQVAVLRGYANSVCMSADSRWIASASDHAMIRLWCVKTNEEVATIRHHSTKSVRCVYMSADSNWIVSGSSDRSVTLWNVEKKDGRRRCPTAVFNGHTGCVRSICMSADRKWIVSGSEDRSVRLWNVETKSQEAILQVGGHVTRSVCMSADSKWIVSGSEDKLVRLWKLYGGNKNR